MSASDGISRCKLDPPCKNRRAKDDKQPWSITLPARMAQGAEGCLREMSFNLKFSVKSGSSRFTTALSRTISVPCFEGDLACRCATCNASSSRLVNCESNVDAKGDSPARLWGPRVLRCQWVPVPRPARKAAVGTSHERRHRRSGARPRGHVVRSEGPHPHPGTPRD